MFLAFSVTPFFFAAFGAKMMNGLILTIILMRDMPFRQWFITPAAARNIFH